MLLVCYGVCVHVTCIMFKNILLFTHTHMYMWGAVTRVATCDGEVHVVSCHDVEHWSKSRPCVIVESGHIMHVTHVQNMCIY